LLIFAVDYFVWFLLLVGWLVNFPSSQRVEAQAPASDFHVKFSKPTSGPAPSGSGPSVHFGLMIGVGFLIGICALLASRGYGQVRDTVYKDSIGKQRKYRSLVGIEEEMRTPTEVDEAIDRAERSGLLDRDAV
jgi:hypothetical protein